MVVDALVFAYLAIRESAVHNVDVEIVTYDLPSRPPAPLPSLPSPDRRPAAAAAYDGQAFVGGSRGCEGARGEDGEGEKAGGASTGQAGELWMVMVWAANHGPNL